MQTNITTRNTQSIVPQEENPLLKVNVQINIAAQLHFSLFPPKITPSFLSIGGSGDIPSPLKALGPLSNTLSKMLKNRADSLLNRSGFQQKEKIISQSISRTSETSPLTTTNLSILRLPNETPDPIRSTITTSNKYEIPELSNDIEDFLGELKSLDLPNISDSPIEMSPYPTDSPSLQSNSKILKTPHPVNRSSEIKGSTPFLEAKNPTENKTTTLGNGAFIKATPPKKQLSIEEKKTTPKSTPQEKRSPTLFKPLNPISFPNITSPTLSEKTTPSAYSTPIIRGPSRLVSSGKSLIES
jgi:hypothetical protein